MCSVEKHPYIMGFKDKENDLSLKYYVSKKEAIQVGIIAGEQKNKPLPVEGKGEKGKAENGKVEGKLDKGILEGKEERGEK